MNKTLAKIRQPAILKRYFSDYAHLKYSSFLIERGCRIIGNKGKTVDIACIDCISIKSPRTQTAFAGFQEKIIKQRNTVVRTCEQCGEGSSEHVIESQKLTTLQGEARMFLDEINKPYISV